MGCFLALSASLFSVRFGQKPGQAKFFIGTLREFTEDILIETFTGKKMEIIK